MDKLYDVEMILLEDEIIYREVVFVLINMLNNKSLGSDGFIIEFFNFFLEIIRIFYCKIIKFWI